MPTALWIAHVKVSDAEAYGEYAPPPRHRGHRGPWRRLHRPRPAVFSYETLEGPDRPRKVVARFPSLQAAHDCYHSEAYQHALSFAKGRGGARN